MQKMSINRLLYVATVMLLGIGSLTVVSCEDDEAEPAALVNAANFTAAVGTSYKVTTPTGIPVTFTNSSENAATYLWDFGDGSDPVTDEDPIHVYSRKGTYTVELTAAAVAGVTPATSKKIIEVVVTDPSESLPNLIVGGGLETADAASWTKIYSGQKNSAGEFQHVEGTFGSTSNKPVGGVGGGFNAKVPAGLAGEAGTIYYQAITITAGKYKFSADIKHDVENTAGGARSFKNYWFETYLGTVQPTFITPAATPDLNGYNYDATAGLSGFISSNWLGAGIPVNNAPWPATDGVLPQDTWFVPSPARADGITWQARKAATIADSNGVMTLTAGTYYFVFKMGFGGDGGFGTNGITIDNLRLVKLQ